MNILICETIKTLLVLCVMDHDSWLSKEMGMDMMVLCPRHALGNRRKFAVGY